MRRAGAGRRARRLVRWYPKEWRARYGEEFTQLLADDIGERPRSWHRTLDVARSGLAAQLAHRHLTRVRLAAVAVIFGAALAGAAVLRVLVDPKEQIKCPRLIRHPLGASCLIVPGHGWVNPMALGIALTGLAVALGVLLAAILRPFQRRFAAAAAIVGLGAGVILWVVVSREPAQVVGYDSRPSSARYPTGDWTAADIALIAIAAVAVALVVLRRHWSITRLRLAAVVLVLGVILAGAAIPRAVGDPGGFFACDYRGGPPGFAEDGCPRVSGPVWLDPTALALYALGAAGAAGLLVTGRRRS